MYAVIETRGKQYRVVEGDIIRVEKIDLPVGSPWEENRVLIISNDGQVLVGNPLVAGARVIGEIVEQGRGKKILVFKYKRRKNYRRTQGHRQSYTGIRITKILVPSVSAPSSELASNIPDNAGKTTLGKSRRKGSRRIKKKGSNDISDK